MASVYGTDIRALDDLPDPEELASEEENVACAQMRRLLTPDGAHDEIGDSDGEYDSFDVRQFLGARMEADDLRRMNANASRILAQDPRVVSAEASVTLAGGELSVEFDSRGTDGPFGGVLSVSDLETNLLLTGD